MKESINWSGRRHLTIFFPESYSVTDNVVTVEMGLIFKKKESVPIHQLASAKLYRGPIQCLFGVCTIVLQKRGEEGNDIILYNIMYSDKGAFYHRLADAIAEYDQMMTFYRYRCMHDGSIPYMERV